MLLLRDHDDLLQRRHFLRHDVPLRGRVQLGHGRPQHVVVALRLEALGRDQGFYADFVQAVLELGQLIRRVDVHLPFQLARLVTY